MFYGAADILVKDATGNEKFQQRIHNQLLDGGEDIIIQQVFQTGTVTADGDSVSAICISDNDPAISEGLSAATFDGVLGTSAGGFTQKSGNCGVDSNVAVDNSTTSLGVILPLAFTAGALGGNSLGADETISSIGICNDSTNTLGANYSLCGLNGRLFAFVDISNVTLAQNEQVTITYTFDMTSDGT